MEAFCKVWVRKSTTSEVCYDRCIEKWMEYSRDRYMCHAPVEPIEIARLTIKSVVTVILSIVPIFGLYINMKSSKKICDTWSYQRFYKSRIDNIHTHKLRSHLSKLISDHSRLTDEALVKSLRFRSGDLCIDGMSCGT